MSTEVTEAERNQRADRFGGKALVPMIPPEVVADLELPVSPTVKEAASD